MLAGQAMPCCATAHQELACPIFTDLHSILAPDVFAQSHPGVYTPFG